MSLAPLAGRFVGIEPVGVYRQMSAIFCERSGLAPVQIHPGCGEAIPFPDGQFDLVLSISAHQYMDVRPALAEMTRVLTPGGELQIVGGTLDTYVVQGLKPIARGSLGGLKTFCVTLVNTMSYSAIQRRAIGSRSGATTAFPVYPPKRQMDRWLRSCGLRELRPATRAYPETCFSYSKPR